MAQVTETLRFENGRYEIGIPWKRGEPHLVNNYAMALKRLKTQEQSLQRKGPEVAQAYDEIIKDYERKGYITVIPKTNDNEQWFLPHFPVIRQDRTTTKVRMVFDAAAKENGKSLNDAVRTGPKLQRELTDVLTRFRRAPIALSGDISEMFLQVGLNEGDRRYHRFLWRNLDPTKEPDHYEFRRLLFGNRASPFCSQHVVLTHAQANATDYPHAAKTVNNSMYAGPDLLRGRCGICRGPRAYRGLALYCATSIIPRTRPFSIKTRSFFGASRILGSRVNVETSHI